VPEGKTSGKSNGDPQIATTSTATTAITTNTIATIVTTPEADDASTNRGPAAPTDTADAGSSTSNAGVAVGAPVAAVAVLAALVAAFIWHRKKNQGAGEERQHDLDAQVHVNRMFDDGNNADVDYAEAVTHNGNYTYAPVPPPTPRKGAAANAAVEHADGYVVAGGDYARGAGVAADEPEYAMPQDDYAPLEGGNNVYSSSA